jgi:hypothetical protein
MSTFVEVAKNNGKSIEEMVDLVRKAYNANGSIGPEPSEQAVNDTKPSAVHCSPVNMNKIFSSNYMPLLAMHADVLQNLAFNNYNQPRHGILSSLSRCHQSFLMAKTTKPCLSRCGQCFLMAEITKPWSSTRTNMHFILNSISRYRKQSPLPI